MASRRYLAKLPALRGVDAMEIRHLDVPDDGQRSSPQLCPEDFGTTVHPALRAAASAFSMSFFGCLRSLIMPHGVASCQHRINAWLVRRGRGGKDVGLEVGADTFQQLRGPVHDSLCDLEGFNVLLFGDGHSRTGITSRNGVGGEAPRAAKQRSSR